jgi:hypothetical protein
VHFFTFRILRCFFFHIQDPEYWLFSFSGS